MFFFVPIFFHPLILSLFFLSFQEKRFELFEKEYCESNHRRTTVFCRPQIRVFSYTHPSHPPFTQLCSIGPNKNAPNSTFTRLRFHLVAFIYELRTRVFRSTNILCTPHMCMCMSVFMYIRIYIYIVFQLPTRLKRLTIAGPTDRRDSIMQL